MHAVDFLPGDSPGDRALGIAAEASLWAKPERQSRGRQNLDGKAEELIQAEVPGIP